MRQNNLGYRLFSLEHIYIIFDMKLNIFDFNLVHGEFSTAFALILFHLEESEFTSGKF